MTIEIEAVALTTFEIAPDGAHCRMHFLEAGGRPACLSLPSGCLTELIMTLPRMATQALRSRHRDDSLRIVYPVDRMRLEQAAVDGSLILTVVTPDGFEVSFSLQADDLRNIQQSVSSRSSAAARPHLVTN